MSSEQKTCPYGGAPDVRPPDAVAPPQPFTSQGIVGAHVKRHVGRIKARIASLRSGLPLPPGDLSKPPANVDVDQTYLLRMTQRFGPIFRVWSNEKHTTVIADAALGRKLLLKHQDSMRTTSTDLTALIPNGFLRNMSGETHKKYRRIVGGGVRAVDVADHDAEVRSILRDALAAMHAMGDRIERDAHRRELKRATTAILMLFVYGLKRSDPEFAAMAAAHDRYVPNGAPIVVQPAMREPFAALKTLFTETVAPRAGKRKQPSVLSFVAASGEMDDTAVGNMMQMVEFARYDLHGFLSWVVCQLSRRPDICDTPKPGGKYARRLDALCDAVVRETLRSEQSEFLFRRVLEDIHFEGYLIPAGSRIRVGIWESHHTEEFFPAPFTFRPERFLEEEADVSHYAPLGIDRHNCVGADWVHGIASRLVAEILSGYRMKQVDDGPAERGPFHYMPAANFVFALEPR
ncbi:MAG: cytochrome P450 [Flavobacteriaceae bacterium]